MSIKQVVSLQYQGIVNRARESVRDVSIPKEGWLCTARKALNMSGAQLARRLGVSRAQVSQTEKSELSGSVTLKKIQHIAEAMGYRFIYAIVPENSVEDIVAARANAKASKIVNETSKQMALESQALSNDEIEFEIKRIQKGLMNELPSNLWNE